MENKVIPIFYACDDNFIKYTVVSLRSMIENASAEYKYHVYVLHTNASEDMQGALKALANDNFEISFEDVTEYLESIKDRLPVRHYYTKTTYFRLFIADMFPQYDKAIYIDSDTVVQGDISRLYSTDVGDAYLAACHEQVMEQIDVYGTYCESVVGVSRHNFFNAGLLLINCEQFRKKALLSRFIEYLGMYNFVVTQDEDYLNLICKDHVFWLDQRWNTELADGLEYPYDVSEAYVLHYIMVNKPWHYRTCRGADVFWSYADKTSVRDQIRDELDSYTDEQRERDRASADNLMQMAIDETKREDNFLNTLNKTRRAPDRVAVVKKIEELEREGRFDIDVEDDPPTRTLLPGEIDYLRRGLLSRLKTKIAYSRAKKFLHRIIDNRLMIIRDIVGLENLQNLNTGAVITCNHFNPFDTFAIHAAYMLSGQEDRTLYRVIREGNYTSYPGFYGFLMRNFYTLPLSSDRRTMVKFTKATNQLLREGNFVLFYPEQSMWWNYRKPKPLKPGAYKFAIQNGVPVLPIFITMKDSDVLGEDGYYIQEYTIHIEKPIWPDPTAYYKDNIERMMGKNAEVWREIYEREYSMPLCYNTETC